ncbi:MAG: hypothetical protein EBY28_21780, partial [Betaproteobacteria bacterium]|nr:hypothetical protein [Betaproteobacteria bacterium]
MRQASKVTMDAGATIDASATDKGDGGKVVLWSDVNNAASQTLVHGGIKAEAGLADGDGGRVETSGHFLNADGFQVSTRANKGRPGLWLIDPYNITIGGVDDAATYDASSGTYQSKANSSNIPASTIAAALGNGNVTIQTGSAGSQAGTITVSSDITKSSGGDATLTLKAADNITIGAAISSTSNKLHVVLTADNDLGVHNGLGIVLLNNNIATNGGNLSFGDGANLTINGVSTKVGGDVYVGGTAQINLDTRVGTATTGGGNFAINGEMMLGNTSGMNVSTGGGNVLFSGLVNSASSYSYTAVPSNNTWTSAVAAAKSGTGASVGDTYLATITSRLENGIAGGAAGYATSWLGGARGGNGYAANSGRTALQQDWYWVTGPEGLLNNGRGQVFFNSATSTGSAVNGSYINWNPGEPNNSNGEWLLQFTGALGQWNDLPPTSTTPSGYVKETNLAASPLTINAGAGSVTFGASVGGQKPVKSVSIIAGTVSIANSITTELSQVYDFNIASNASVSLISTTGDVTLSRGISLSGAGNSLLVKSVGNIVIAGGSSGNPQTIQTNNGNITFWSDSDAGGVGNIQVGPYTTLNSANGSTTQASGGGKITLAGGLDNGGSTVTSGRTAGDGLPDGYASGNASGIGSALRGVHLQTAGVMVYSGGGNIFMAGQGAASVPAGGQLIGFQFEGGVIDSGTGKIALYGRSNATNNTNNQTSYGMHLNGNADNASTNITSANTGADAITMVGDASTSTTTGSSGILVYYSGAAASAGAVITATGAGGGITLIGKSSTSIIGTGLTGDGIDLNFTQVLAKSGPITLNGSGGPYGISMGGRTLAGNGVTIGQAAGVTVNGVDMGVSTSAIVLNTDSLRVNSGASSGWAAKLASAGALTVQPIGTSFSSALTWPVTGLGLGTGLTGLTLGKAGNIADITLASAASLAGPINIIGGNLTLNAGATLTNTLSGSDVVIAAAGNFANSAGSAAISTSGSGRWIVYSARPSLDSFGGLASGNPGLWGQSYDSLAPSSVPSGKRYVFSNSADAVITATVTNASKIYGETASLANNIAYTGLPFSAGTTYTVFSNISTSNVWSSLPSLTSNGTAAAASVGSSPYAMSYLAGTIDASAGNNFSFVTVNTAALTVSKAHLVLTADAKTRVYGDANPALSATLSGFVNSETLSNSGVSGSATLSTTATTASATSSATITAATGTLTAANYDFSTPINGVLSITPRPLTLSGSHAYDGSTGFSASTLTATNLVGSDCNAGLVACGLVGIASVASKNVSAGIQALSLGSLSLSSTIANNYSLTGFSGSGSLTTRSITYTAPAVNKTYDGVLSATGVPTVTAGALVAGDLLTASTLAYTDANAGTGNKTVNVSAAVIQDSNGVGSSMASNYAMAYLPNATSTVTPKALTPNGLTAPTSKVYDANTSAIVSGVAVLLATEAAGTGTASDG